MPSGIEANNIEDEFLQRLKLMSHRNKTIESKFVQIKKVQGIRKEVVSNGDFYYDNSGRMALLYTQPKDEKLIMHGEEFDIVSQGRTIKVDASNPIMMQVSNMMRAAMSGDIECFANGWDVEVTLFDKVYEVKIRPKDKKISRYLDSILMKFQLNDMTLNSLDMYDSRGGYTKYQFVSKKINKGINPDIFIL